MLFAAVPEVAFCDLLGDNRSLKTRDSPFQIAINCLDRLRLFTTGVELFIL
jgi:hypothetical protein